MEATRPRKSSIPTSIRHAINELVQVHTLRFKIYLCYYYYYVCSSASCETEIEFRLSIQWLFQTFIDAELSVMSSPCVPRAPEGRRIAIGARPNRVGSIFKPKIRVYLAPPVVPSSHYFRCFRGN